MNVLLWVFTFILVIVSVLMVLVILAQRAKSDGGVGAALGGGMAEAAFGGGSSSVLAKLTRTAAIAFFVLSLALYLGHLYMENQPSDADGLDLPSGPGLLPEEAAEGTPLPDLETLAPNLSEEPAAPEGTAEPGAAILPPAEPFVPPVDSEGADSTQAEPESDTP